MNDERTYAAPSIKVRRDGPYLLRGAFVLCDADGTPVDVVRRDDTIVLCRCGASENKPFCDGSHKMIGFTDPGSIPPATP